MIEEARCLKLKTLNQELEQLEMEYASMFDEMNAIRGQLNAIRYARNAVEVYQKGKHMFWERLTKRKDFLAYKANLEVLQNCPQSENELNDRYEAAENKANKLITKNKLVQKIADKKQEIAQVKKATTLEAMGMTPLEAINQVKAAGIPLTWGDGDFQIYMQMHDSENTEEVQAAKNIDTFPPTRPRLHKCILGRLVTQENHADLENI